jgi:hypothetical protein
MINIYTKELCLIFYQGMISYNKIKDLILCKCYGMLIKYHVLNYK